MIEFEIKWSIFSIILNYLACLIKGTNEKVKNLARGNESELKNERNQHFHHQDN